MVAVAAVVTVVPITALATAGAQSSGFAKAPPGLSAAVLASETEVGAGIGWQTLDVEDDGGLTGGSGAYESQARILTSGGAILTIRLTTTGDEKKAGQVYESLTEGLPGRELNAGDEGVAGAGVAYVRKGAQVLEVTSEPSGGAEAAAELGPVEQQAIGAAAVLALNMTGDATKKLLIGIPEGAEDPCKVVTAADFEKVFGGKVTARPIVSDDPPGLACSYETKDGSYRLTIVANEQLLSGAPPTDAFAAFEEMAQEGVPSGVVQTTGADPMTYTGPRTVAALQGPCKQLRIVTLDDGRSGATPPKLIEKMRRIVEPPAPEGSDAAEVQQVSDALDAARATLDQLISGFAQANATKADVDKAITDLQLKTGDFCNAKQM